MTCVDPQSGGPVGARQANAALSGDNPEAHTQQHPLACSATGHRMSSRQDVRAHDPDRVVRQVRNGAARLTRRSAIPQQPTAITGNPPNALSALDGLDTAR